MTLTRAKLEQLVGDLIERTRGPVMQALEDARHQSQRRLNEVMLVGGQTRMPAVIETGAQDLSARNRTRASTLMRWWPSARPSRQACSRRGEGCAAARCHAAFAGSGDAGWRDDQVDRAQHDHSDAQERDLSARRKITSRRSRSMCCKASANWPAITRAWALPPGRHSSGPARRAADRGDLRHRRQRHSQCHGPR